LQSKIGLLPEGNKFKSDFTEALINYYKNNHQLIGVLIRDVESDEKDLKASFERLKTKIIIPQGLSLLAIYTTISKSKWLNIINE